MQASLSEQRNALHTSFSGREIFIFDIDDTLFIHTGGSYKLIQKELIVEALSSLQRVATLAIATDKRTWSACSEEVLGVLASNGIHFCPELVLSNRVVIADWMDLVVRTDQDSAKEAIGGNVLLRKTVRKLNQDTYQFKLGNIERYVSFDVRLNDKANNIFTGKILYILEILFMLGYSLELPANNPNLAFISNYKSSLPTISNSRVTLVDDNSTFCRHARFLDINVVYADTKYAIDAVITTIKYALADLQQGRSINIPEIMDRMPTFVEQPVREALNKNSVECQQQLAQILRGLGDYNYGNYLLRLNPSNLLRDIKVQILMNDALLILASNEDLKDEDRQILSLLRERSVQFKRLFDEDPSTRKRCEDDYVAKLKSLSKSLANHQGEAIALLPESKRTSMGRACQELSKNSPKDLACLAPESLAAEIAKRSSMLRAESQARDFEAIRAEQPSSSQSSFLPTFNNSWLNPFRAANRSQGHGNQPPSQDGTESLGARKK